MIIALLGFIIQELFVRLRTHKQLHANVLYRYELSNDQQLVNPKLLLNLPAIPGPNHDGGKVVIGQDNNVYTIGDLISQNSGLSTDHPLTALAVY
jgi:hypothetical protein